MELKEWKEREVLGLAVDEEAKAVRMREARVPVALGYLTSQPCSSPCKIRWPALQSGIPPVRVHI